jgi:hypothetical protein
MFLIVGLCGCYSQYSQTMVMSDGGSVIGSFIKSDEGGKRISNTTLFQNIDHNCGITANAPKIANMLNQVENDEEEIVPWLFYLSRMSPLLKETLRLSSKNMDFIFIVNYLEHEVYSGVALVQQHHGSELLWQRFGKLDSRNPDDIPSIKRHSLGLSVSDWIWSEVETAADWSGGLRIEDFRNYEICTGINVSLCLWRVKGVEGVWFVLSGPEGISELGYLDMMIMDSLLGEVYYGPLILLRPDFGWQEIREKVKAFRAEQKKRGSVDAEKDSSPEGAGN